MSALPYEPSDSDDDNTSPSSSPAQETASTTDSDVKDTLNARIPKEKLIRLNHNVKIPTEVNLILGTDLASGAFLQRINMVANSVQVLEISVLIEKEDKKHSQNKKNDESSFANKSPKYITYTLSLIPNTNTLIGTPNVDVLSKYANIIAKKLFPCNNVQNEQKIENDQNDQNPLINQFYSTIASLYIYHSLPISQLSSHDQLTYTSAEKYPYIYSISNHSRLNIPQTDIPTDPTTKLPLLALPTTMGLTGLTAALFTMATLKRHPCQTFVSVQNATYLTELWTSFERVAKMYQFKAQFGVPSIYADDKLTMAVKMNVMQIILRFFQTSIAENQNLLPHQKQSGSAPKSMFF